MNTSDLEKNKALINRFDEAFFRPDGEPLWKELVSDSLTDHTAPGGSKKGKDCFDGFFKGIHTGLSNIKVEVIDQIAENDLVVTHKVLTGEHTGHLFGAPPTGKSFRIDAMEMIRVKDNKYVDHWVKADLWENLTKGMAAFYGV